LDILSIIGLVLALNAILIGAVLKGAGLMALVSSAAFMIVVVGTCAAIFIQTPLRTPADCQDCRVEQHRP
jgi:chemotaxis protein MotA